MLGTCYYVRYTVSMLGTVMLLMHVGPGGARVNTLQQCRLRVGCFQSVRPTAAAAMWQASRAHSTSSAIEQRWAAAVWCASRSLLVPPSQPRPATISTGQFVCEPLVHRFRGHWQHISLRVQVPQLQQLAASAAAAAAAAA